MPNWVFNKVWFAGEKKDIEALRNFVKSEESAFDFNKIIPMPEELKVTAGADEHVARACATARRQGLTTCKEYESSNWARDRMTFNEWAETGEIYLSNIEKYGAADWYDWCCEHWNTKWNASEPIWYGKDMVTFDTAWTCPYPIYQKLGELFPEVEISVHYADEDLGSNCGIVRSLEGDFWTDYINDFEFACDVWGYDVDEMRAEYQMEEA